MDGTSDVIVVCTLVVNAVQSIALAWIAAVYRRSNVVRRRSDRSP